ncbi:MAG TPA: DUF441 domain-containing protein [Firmicutes bacterium]|nr:DUF441 domain-containing protein [Bacillota bacterium]
MDSTYILLGILIIAIFGKANSVAVAAGVLLLIRLAHGDHTLFPFLQKQGMFWGLALLIAAILIPIAQGEFGYHHITKVFSSWLGIVALVLSFLTTYLSGLGLQFLTVQQHSDIMLALILGAVLAAAFLGGVPVGPLITSGLLALIARIFARP